MVALSSALLAVLAAVSSLLSGHHVNESMLNQIKASDRWAQYQAKSIKSTVWNSQLQILETLGKKPPESQIEKMSEYKKEQEEISLEAREFEKESSQHLAAHQIMARAVTMFQVAIAIGAISALTRRRYFWYVSLIFGGAGILFLGWGLI